MVQKNDVVFRDRSIVRKKQTFLKSDLESIEKEEKYSARLIYEKGL
jgi:hypothetical protein